MASSLRFLLVCQALGAATPPIVPYMGMYLTDLMTLDEVHKNTLEPIHPGMLCWFSAASLGLTPHFVSVLPGYINFTKRVQISSVMKIILEQQSAEYALQPIDCVQVAFK